jgi:glucose/arabinose dehydrogenase
MLKSLGIAALLGVAACAVCEAQDRASPPLPELPAIVFSADYDILVEELAGGLQNPWSMQFLPGGDILVTERPGRLRVVRYG